MFSLELTPQNACTILLFTQNTNFVCHFYSNWWNDYENVYISFQIKLKTSTFWAKSLVIMLPKHKGQLTSHTEASNPANWHRSKGDAIDFLFSCFHLVNCKCRFEDFIILKIVRVRYYTRHELKSTKGHIYNVMMKFWV